MTAAQDEAQSCDQPAEQDLIAVPLAAEVVLESICRTVAAELEAGTAKASEEAEQPQEEITILQVDADFEDAERKANLRTAFDPHQPGYPSAEG